MGLQYQDYWKNAHIDTIWMDRNDQERLRLTAEFKSLVFRCLQPIADADISRRMKKDEALLFVSPLVFEEALTDIPEVRNELNLLTDDAQLQKLVVDYFWRQLPEWAKSKQNFENTFRVRVIEPELIVSHGFYRGHLDFANRCVGTQNDDHSEARLVSM